MLLAGKIKNSMKNRLALFAGLSAAFTAGYNELISLSPSGRSPKEYGQWLQATGRQKWTKSTRR
jgi:hypothetical protein